MQPSFVKYNVTQEQRYVNLFFSIVFIAKVKVVRQRHDAEVSVIRSTEGSQEREI